VRLSNLSLSDFHKITEFASTITTAYSTDLDLKQAELDGQLPLEVSQLMVGKMNTCTTRLALQYPQHRDKILNASLFSIISPCLLAFAPQSPMARKIGRTFQKLAPYSLVLDVINVVVFYQLSCYLVAAGCLTGLVCSQIQRRQMLPLKVHRLIQSLEFFHPIYILLTPTQSRWFLIKKGLTLLDSATRLSNLLIRHPLWVWLETPQLKAVNKNLVQDWVQHKKNQSNEFFWIEFDPESIHRIPDIFKKKIDDGLENCQPEEISQLLLERLKLLERDIKQFPGLNKLITGYTTGRFIDQVPPCLNRFNKIANLCFRNLLKKNDEDFLMKVGELSSAGLQCSDRWVADMSELSGINKTFEEEIHDKFSQIRSEILNEEIDRFLRCENLDRLRLNAGGLRNVHFYQNVHLSLRKSFRTSFSEASLASSAHQVSGLGLLQMYFQKKIFGLCFRLNQNRIFWEERLKDLLIPKIIQDSLGHLREFREIPNQQLLDWISRVNERYDLVTEDSKMDPLFLNTYEVNGIPKHELTDLGIQLVLLDLGIFKLKRF
jgi:hypothetical protein